MFPSLMSSSLYQACAFLDRHFILFIYIFCEASNHESFKKSLFEK